MTASYDDIALKYQRDLNRLQDTDRNARKRGLAKIFEDIPWDKLNSSKSGDGVDDMIHLRQWILKEFIESPVITNIIVNDPIEKCRETAIRVLEKSLTVCHVNIYSVSSSESKVEAIVSIVVKLCQRIGVTSGVATSSGSEITSFLETSEELRFQILKIMSLIVKGEDGRALPHYSIDSFSPTIANAIVSALTKTLLDPFPEVKREGGDLLSVIAILSPNTVRLHFKQLLKGLTVNALHQHSKTRSITLKALGLCVSCIGDEYEAVMKEPILPLLSRFLNDRIPSTRKELVDLCLHVLTSRIKQRPKSLILEDLQMIVFLLLLTKDESDVVVEHASQSVRSIIDLWEEEAKRPIIGDDPMDVEDGELALKSSHVHVEIVEDTYILSYYIKELSGIFLEGIENWTVDARTFYLKGLETFITLTKVSLMPIIPQLLASLGIPIRDEEAVIRQAAEQACKALGTHIPYQDLLDILLPKLQGDVIGADTFSHRVSAVRLLTHLLQGFPSQQSSFDQQLEISERIARSLANKSNFDYRESSMREALLLNVRSLIETFPISCKKSIVNRHLCSALIFLQAKVPNDDDNNVISEASKRELSRLAALNDVIADSDEAITMLQAALNLVSNHSNDQKNANDSHYPTLKLFSQHFEYILNTIVPDNIPSWTPSDVAKGTFEALVRECPRWAWKYHQKVIQVILHNVQPKSGPAPGSVEANMASYMAIRGEEAIQTTAEIDIRLSLLALLEGLLRAGSKDWECGPFMAEAADTIIKQILLPNLVWKVGRVEATIRKVCLAACYAMMKAGSIKVETLYSTASEFVPLLVSHLDDTDVSPRHLACLCLSVIFERLRGAFGEQAIYEMYPKLLKRLDDSHDEVRIAVCTTLIMFLRCAPKACYSSTTVEYMLDQYFIHLDDSEEDIQEAVFKVIIELLNINPETVLQKATVHLNSNRSTAMVQRVIDAAKAFQK